MYNARPTYYRGKRMRSRLEADYAGMLDGYKRIWDYEPYAFASGNEQWLPDFLVVNGLEGPGFHVEGKFSNWYVEVKPDSVFHDWIEEGGLKDHILELMGRMARCTWDSEPEAIIELCFRQYQQGKPNTTAYRIIAANNSPWIFIDAERNLLWGDDRKQHQILLWRDPLRREFQDGWQNEWSDD